MIYIEATLDQGVKNTDIILWTRLKYYYNHGALEFNRKIVNENNSNLTPYHFRIGTDKYIETLVSNIPCDKIIFTISGDWDYEELSKIKESMSIVFSDYVGSLVKCEFIEYN